MRTDYIKKLKLEKVELGTLQFRPERIRSCWFCGQASKFAMSLGMFLFWQKDDVPLGSGVTEWWSLHLSVISSELSSTRR